VQPQFTRLKKYFTDDPEFQVVAQEVVSGEPTTEFIAGTSEPSVGAVVQREPSEGVTEGVGEPAVGDVVSPEPAPAIVDERETVVEPTLEPTSRTHGRRSCYRNRGCSA
jgi:hypothetical protein